MIICRHYKARELFDMGLINKVVKGGELMPAARDLAKTLASKRPDAATNTKHGVNAVFFGSRLF
jgi:enoyl-CoA hydratase/carnithine racemase